MSAAPGLSGDDERTQVVTAALTSTAPRPVGEQYDAGLLPVGARVAEFEITRVVGQGGFGVVYEAWDPTLERVVAIKEYLPTSLSTRLGDGTVMPLSERHRETFELGMRSFINEARLLAQFDHPSLLKVYRFWQERGTAYMVMPFYRGETLRQALAAAPGGVDEDWLMRIVDGVTQALGVMHASACYHRDIAPDNIILLEGSGRPVLLDFGAARRVITDKTQAITVILKPGYAPIEQYAEMPGMTQGAWTDVYALAAVMHMAVCGRSPPPSVARLLSDNYVPLAGNATLSQCYSLQLLAAIDAGLGVRPEQRPQSMAELREALGFDGVTTSISIPVRPPVTPGRSPPDDGATRIIRPRPPAPPVPSAPPVNIVVVPDRRKVTAFIGALVVLVAAGVGGWWWSRGRADPVGVGPTASSLPSNVIARGEAQPQPSLTPSPSTSRTPAESLQALGAGAAPGFEVTATPRKSEVVIGKDRLAFDVRSQRNGFVYVYLLSSGGELFLLFPNLLDKYNKIAAGTTLSLPRASWPMNAGGPAGNNRFVVLVSQHERDFSASGAQNDGVFPQFALPLLAALEATRGSGPTPLLGKPVCPANTPSPCNDVYGVGNFTIVEK